LKRQVLLLCPFFTTCTLEIGGSAEDALSIIGTREVEALKEAILYATFCELMPAVRQGRYSVKAVKKGFWLTYRESAFNAAEEYDFVLHEIGKATDASALETRSLLFSELVRAWPIWNPRVVDAVFDRLYQHHLKSIRESPLLPLEAYDPSFGFTRDEFITVRAALFALASFCNGMHLGSAQERDRSIDPETTAKFHSEFLEWNTPILTADFVYSCITRVTMLSRAKIDDVFLPLTLNASTGDFANAGDGYLPPLIRLQNNFLFNPHVVRLMTHERNLLYVVNKRNRERLQELESTERDALCTRIFKRKVVNPAWLSAILSRSGLGTWRSWSALGEAIP
jgi:hypothetical protein